MQERYNEEYLYKDIYTIINMMNDELKSKINPKFIEFLKENGADEYISCIDSKKPLRYQELREEIKLMLSIIYINYLCNSEEKESILKEEKDNIEKYNKNLYDNMFKKLEEPEIEGKKENNQLIILEKENIIKKIMNKIKNFFKRKYKV